MLGTVCFLLGAPPPPPPPPPVLGRDVESCGVDEPAVLII